MANVILLPPNLHYIFPNSNGTGIDIIKGVRLPFEQQIVQPLEQLREAYGDHGDHGSQESLTEIDDESDDEDINELAGRLSEIKDIMGHLYRLSFKIRSVDYRLLSTKPLLLKSVDPDSGIDLFRGNVGLDHQYEPQLLGYASFDRQYVMESLSHLRKASTNLERELSHSPDKDLLLEKETSKSSEEDFLFERLSKAITNRRRYFTYWRRHALKLSRIEDESVHQEKKPDQKAASKPAGDLMLGAGGLNVEPINPTDQMPTPGPKTLLSVTDYSNYKGNVDDRVEGQSIISYATTAFDTQGNFVEVPQLPTETLSKPEFECPYCWVVCPSWDGSGKPWR